MEVRTEELVFNKDYECSPIPEHPSVLFNIHKAKICIKPFFILPPEKISYDYSPNEDDTDNELDNDLKLSFKGIKNDIKTKLYNKKTIIDEDQLYGKEYQYIISFYLYMIWAILILLKAYYIIMIY